MNKEKLKPKLFSVMKTYTKEQFLKDVVAGRFSCSPVSLWSSGPARC